MIAYDCLTFCMLGYFAYFAEFFINFFQEYHQSLSVKQFGSRSGHILSNWIYYLVPNCLQRLSADDIGR